MAATTAGASAVPPDRAMTRTPTAAARNVVVTARTTSVAGPRVVIRAGKARRARTVVPAPIVAPVSKAGRTTFRVTYVGFTAPARAAFQRAVDVWASKLTTTVPITVLATFEPLGSGILGSAGPSTLFRDFPGAPRSGTYYVDAIANKRSGVQISTEPDILADFSSSFNNWHYGTGAAPSGTYDFTTVVLHELGHGLGFLGAGSVASGLGSVRFGGVPTSFDLFTEVGTGPDAGTALLSYPDRSTQLASVLRSNNVVLDAPQVRTANGNLTARLYAPSTWQEGSSYSHLDESTYPAGNVNSLMTPQLSPGETIRNPGPITAATLAGIGW